MGEQSKIAWCDSTLNFWSGCTKVSAGCANCYAETLSGRKLTDAKGSPTIGQWGKGAPRKLHESAFKLAVKLNKRPWVCDECGAGDEGQAQGVPIDGCYCNGKLNKFHRRRIFSLSLGDIADAEVPLDWFNRVMVTVDQCRDVDWILCTKRCDEFLSRWLKVCQHWDKANTMLPPNVVVLTSVENQEQADKRISELLRIPAARRGLSCEPLLGPVDFTPQSIASDRVWPDSYLTRIDWVIIGGESGRNARPCNVEWVRSLSDQCKSAGTPCFVKQLGANSFRPSQGEVIKFLRDPKGGDWNEWPDELKVREFYR